MLDSPSDPRDPPVLKILRRVNFGTGRRFGTEVAKGYREDSEISGEKKAGKRGTGSEKLRRWQYTTDLGAVVSLVWKGPLRIAVVLYSPTNFLTSLQTLGKL